jgi:hypothetical protein
LGLGLFAVSIKLATSDVNATEPVMIGVDDQEFTKGGRVVGKDILFVPLAGPEVAAGLRELQKTGTLWLSVRNTWIAHGGQAVGAALTEYGRTCADRGTPG